MFPDIREFSPYLGEQITNSDNNYEIVLQIEECQVRILCDSEV